MVGCDKNYSVGPFYHVGDALGEVAEFFTISALPYGAVFWVLDEVTVLQELTGVCVKDDREYVMGKHWVAACSGVRGVLKLCKRCSMVSCVMDSTRLRMLYAGAEGGVDTLGCGAMVSRGVTLGGARIAGCGSVKDSSLLALESLS